MSHVNIADSRRLAEIQRTLGEYGGSAAAPLSDVLPRMRALLRTDKIGAWSLTRTDSGLAFDFVDMLGVDVARVAAAFGAIVRNRRSGWQGIKFDPLRPDPSQRNRVDPHLAGDGSRRAVRAYFDLLPESRGTFAATGTIGDQVRTLVCDGPRLLGWVGAIREDPFTDREVDLLGRLIPALRRRLGLHRSLGPPGLSLAALAAALDAIPSAAFLVKPPARVLLANAAGRALLARDAVTVSASVRAALDGAPSAFDACEVRAAGLPSHALLVARGAPADATARSDALASSLALTPRQGQVLALVARGLANRDIAVDLGVTEGAVELHVGALLSRLDCENRSELVARVWSGGE